VRQFELGGAIAVGFWNRERKMKPSSREIDWKFCAAAPIVFIALYLGLTAFHRWFQLGRGLSVDGLTMIGATLFAAAAGFLAILYQVRSSSKQLRDQIRAQRDAEQAEQERQKKAVATAILFEVDYIYRYIIRDVGDLVKGYPPGLQWAYELVGRGVERMPFTAYESNASVLGTLDQALAEGVVHLYGHFTHFFGAVNNLSAAVDRAASASLGDMRRTLVEELAKHVESWLPPVRKLTAEVSERLCEFTGVPRERIAALTSEPSNAQTN